jgi:lysophospholipase L1-like esterase
MTTNPLRWTPKLKGLYGKAPYDVSRSDGFEAPTLVRYNEVIRKLAAELHIPLVDLHKEFQQREIDKLLLDGMHPSDAGHEVIAQLLVPVIRELAQSGASSKK